MGPCRVRRLRRRSAPCDRRAAISAGGPSCTAMTGRRTRALPRSNSSSPRRWSWPAGSACNITARRLPRMSFGGGNKLIHNVTGGIGVVRGQQRNLRPGLPWQGVHDGESSHEPLRLSVMLEAPQAAIQTVLDRNESARSSTMAGCTSSPSKMDALRHIIGPAGNGQDTALKRPPPERPEPCEPREPRDQAPQTGACPHRTAMRDLFAKWPQVAMRSCGGSCPKWTMSSRSKKRMP